MSFRNKGYFGAEALEYAKNTRAEFAAWFDGCDELNEIAHELLANLRMQIENPQHLAAIALYLRILSSFSSAIILLERGLAQDAGAIIRSAVESTIFLKATIADPRFVDELAYANESSRLTLINISLAGEEGGIEVNDQNKSELERTKSELDFLKKKGLLKEIKVREVAKRIGLLGMYNTAYRYFSNSNAHPSSSSLNRYLKFDPNGKCEAVLWSPQAEDLQHYLYSICACIAVCFTSVTEILELSPEIEAKLQTRLDIAIARIKKGSDRQTD